MLSASRSVDRVLLRRLSLQVCVALSTAGPTRALGVVALAGQNGTAPWLPESSERPGSRASRFYPRWSRNNLSPATNQPHRKWGTHDATESRGRPDNAPEMVLLSPAPVALELSHCGTGHRNQQAIGRMIHMAFNEALRPARPRGRRRGITGAGLSPLRPEVVPTIAHSMTDR